MAVPEITDSPTNEQEAVQLLSREILAEVRSMPFNRWLDMTSAVNDAARTVRARLVAGA